MISTWLLWSRSIHQTQGVRRRPAPSAETETPSLTTVDETSPTTVDTLDTATVVTSDRFDELHARDSGRIRQEPECTDCAVAFEPDYCGHV